MIQAIFFDLDGTLVDTLPLYIKSYDRALQEQGFSLNNKDIATNCFGKKEKTICQNLGIPEKTEQFRRTYLQGVDDHISETVLFGDVIKCLEKTKKQGIKRGIISISPSLYVNKIVEQLNLIAYFDIILGCDDVANAKPDPEAIMLACQNLHVSPENSIMVGDSTSDILMGKSAGCKTVLFYPPSNKLFYDLNTLKESHPDSIISNFSELNELITHQG